MHAGIPTPPRSNPTWQQTPPRTRPPLHSACSEIQAISGQYASYWNAILSPHAMKLGQGYIFTGICHSVHREGSTWAGAPQTRYTPWTSNPPDQVPPPDKIHPTDQVHPREQVHPPDQVHSPGPGTPPRTRHTSPRTRHTPIPPDQVTPGTRYPPPGRYGQQAGGTHPTGMHSCLV